MDIEELLNRAGYKEYESKNIDFLHIRKFYKRIKSSFYCVCNERPPQICVSVYECLGQTSFEVSIIGESKEGWIDFKFYSLDSLDNLPYFESKLQEIWESLF